MNTLSFREQAAIAFATQLQGVHWNSTQPGVYPRLHSYDPEEAVAASQRLADACCAKWGHDEGNAETRHNLCTRCGAKR